MILNKAIIILIGPPGSGKGTISRLCTEKLGCAQLSTGNLCRKEIAEGTEIGKQIDFALKSGKLVSDSLISKMVEDWLFEKRDAGQAIILDGYPRTVAQADSLYHLLNGKLNEYRVFIIRMNISDDAIIARLVGRYVCSNKECQAVYSVLKDSPLAPKKDMICDVCSHALIRRKDDQEDSIRERLITYHQHEQALLDFYVGKGQTVIEFDAAKPFGQLFQEFGRLVGIEVS